jgi:hypothetical protein
VVKTAKLEGNEESEEREVRGEASIKCFLHSKARYGYLSIINKNKF